MESAAGHLADSESHSSSPADIPLEHSYSNNLAVLQPPKGQAATSVLNKNCTGQQPLEGLATHKPKSGISKSTEGAAFGGQQPPEGLATPNFESSVTIPAPGQQPLEGLVRSAAASVSQKDTNQESYKEKVAVYIAKKKREEATAALRASRGGKLATYDAVNQLVSLSLSAPTLKGGVHSVTDTGLFVFVLDPNISVSSMAATDIWGRDSVHRRPEADAKLATDRIEVLSGAKRKAEETATPGSPAKRHVSFIV